MRGCGSEAVYLARTEAKLGARRAILVRSGDYLHWAARCWFCRDCSFLFCGAPPVVSKPKCLDGMQLMMIGLCE